MKSDQVKCIYYTILGSYVLWSFVCAYLFSTYGTPKLMTVVIANLNNVAIGVTSFQLLWINHPAPAAGTAAALVPPLGSCGCGVFYLGLAALVFVFKIWPYM